MPSVGYGGAGGNWMRRERCGKALRATRYASNVGHTTPQLLGVVNVTTRFWPRRRSSGLHIWPVDSPSRPLNHPLPAGCLRLSSASTLKSPPSFQFFFFQFLLPFQRQHFIAASLQFYRPIRSHSHSHICSGSGSGSAAPSACRLGSVCLRLARLNN